MHALLLALLLPATVSASDLPAHLALAPAPPQPIRIHEVQRHQRLARRGLAVALVANVLEIPLLWSETRMSVRESFQDLRQVLPGRPRRSHAHPRALRSRLRRGPRRHAG